MVTPVDNHGERLVPGESHPPDETVRHKSSYAFFKAVIISDGVANPKILDLGCGVGHGALTFSEIPDSQIVAFDASEPAIEYAKANYAASNVSYSTATAEEFLERDETFDYVVSRHVLEHIPNGLDLARQFRFTKRLMVNVPYLEPAFDDHQNSNPHHELNDISEKDFDLYELAQFFFEDLQGVTGVSPTGANSIICASRSAGMPPIDLPMPFPAWKPASKLEALGLSMYDAGLKEKAYQMEDQNKKNEINRLNSELTKLHAKLNELNVELGELRERYGKVNEAYAGLMSSGSVKAALAISKALLRLRSR